jgi:uncharacterized protein
VRPSTPTSGSSRPGTGRRAGGPRRDGADPVLDLAGLALGVGQAREIPVALRPAEIVLAGQPYRVEDPPLRAVVEVSASAGGRQFRLRAEGALVGPCWRCIEPARIALSLDSWEYQEHGRQGEQPDDDLDCEYLEDDRLDVSAWARDAIVEALPPTIVCRPDCAGLCAGCGADLNVGACRCKDPGPDPRWAPLAELAERLEEPAEPG